MHGHTLVKCAVTHHVAHLLSTIPTIVSIKSTAMSTNVLGADVSTCT